MLETTNKLRGKLLECPLELTRDNVRVVAAPQGLHQLGELVSDLTLHAKGVFAIQILDIPIGSKVLREFAGVRETLNTGVHETGIPKLIRPRIISTTNTSRM